MDNSRPIPVWCNCLYWPRKHIVRHPSVYPDLCIDLALQDCRKSNRLLVNNIDLMSKHNVRYRQFDFPFG